MRNRCIAAFVALGVVCVAACSSKSPVEAPASQRTGPCVPCLVPDPVIALSEAYQARDPDQLARLLHPDFLFLGTNQEWDAAEEARIHRRMFRPADIPSSEASLPSELWLDGVAVSLVQAGSWTERHEYWWPVDLGLRLLGADFNYSVHFETRGDTDFQVQGAAYFVIAQARSTSSEPGPFLLYRWHDLGDVARSEPTDWTSMKRLYR